MNKTKLHNFRLETKKQILIFETSENTEKSFKTYD